MNFCCENQCLRIVDFYKKDGQVVIGGRIKTNEVVYYEVYECIECKELSLEKSIRDAEYIESIMNSQHYT